MNNPLPCGYLEHPVPLVTVLMTCWNSEMFLQEAIDSVKRQHERSWELVIVDDGSTDTTREILQSQDDHRVRLILLDQNLGIPKALNHGLVAARGQYIARLDSDDVAAPSRLMTQVEFMESNPDVALVGGWLRTCGHGESRIIGHRASLDVGPQLLRGNRLLSSSVIIRTSILRLHDLQYSSEHSNAQDYELWLSVAQHGRVVILPEVVGTYRYHANQQTAVHGVRQRRLALHSQFRALRGAYKIPNATRMLRCVGWMAFLRNIAGLQLHRARSKVTRGMMNQ